MLTTVEQLRENFSNELVVPTAPIMLRFADSNVEIPLDIVKTTFGKCGEVIVHLITTPAELEARIAEDRRK